MPALLLKVLPSASGWRVYQFGQADLEYASREEAITAAIEQAKQLASAGEIVAVVMNVMTSVYGAGGFIRTIPTRRKPASVVRLPVDAPVDAYEELIASVKPSSTVRLPA